MNKPKKTLGRQFLLELPESGIVNLSSIGYEVDINWCYLYISNGKDSVQFVANFYDSKCINPEIGRISRMIGTLNDLKEKLQAIKTYRVDQENLCALAGGVDIIPNRKTSMIDEDEPSAPGADYDF